MKESELLRLTLDWLAANGYLAFRMNTGAIKLEKRFFRFGVPGMADILAFRDTLELEYTNSQAVWLELKATGNDQSEFQKSFEQQVIREGHRYAVVRSLEDVKEALR